MDYIFHKIFINSFLNTTAFHAAVNNGNIKIVNLLLTKLKVDINIIQIS